MYERFLKLPWYKRVMWLKKIKGAYKWISDTFETDPYHFRRSPNIGHDYNREYDEIVGVSVAWNQLCDTTDTSVTVPSGHKYIARISGSWSVGTSNGTALTVDGSNNDMVIDLTLALGSTIADYIVTQGNTNGVNFFRKYFPNDYYAYDSGSIQSVGGLVSHDMVGKNLLSNSSVDFGNYTINGTGGETAGTRRGCTGYIRCKSDTAYIVSGGVSSAYTQTYIFNFVSVAFYDSTKTFISRAYANNVNTLSFTTPSNAMYLRVSEEFKYKDGVTPASTVTIDTFAEYERQLEFGSVKSTYEQYQKHSYTLDSTITLRGKFNLVDGKLKADGDVYPPSGEGTRKYAEYTFSGNESWSQYSGDVWYTLALSDALYSADSGIVSADFVSQTAGGGTAHNGNKEMWVQASPAYKRLYLCITGATTQADMQSATSGKTILYPLATPTTFSADPYTSPQVCDPSGTEEYVSSSIVPIGHNTKYAQK